MDTYPDADSEANFTSDLRLLWRLKRENTVLWAFLVQRNYVLDLPPQFLDEYFSNITNAPLLKQAIKKRIEAECKTISKAPNLYPHIDRLAKLPDQKPSAIGLLFNLGRHACFELVFGQYIRQHPSNLAYGYADLDDRLSKLAYEHWNETQEGWDPMPLRKDIQKRAEALKGCSQPTKFRGLFPRSLELLLRIEERRTLLDITIKVCHGRLSTELVYMIHDHLHDRTRIDGFVLEEFFDLNWWRNYLSLRKSIDWR
jgi:hypothetical protein